MYFTFTKKQLFLSIVVLGLLLVRISLEPVLLYSINAGLRNNLNNYSGSISNVKIYFFQGSYVLHDFLLKKKNSPEEYFIKAKRLKVDIDWDSLLIGYIGTNIHIDKLAVQLLDAKTESRKQFGKEEKPSSWQNLILSIIPLQINSLKLSNSMLHFGHIDYPSFDNLEVNSIDAEISDLLLAKDNSSYMSRFELNGSLNSKNSLLLNGKINLQSTPIQYDINLLLDEYQLSQVNELLMLYVPLDITKGKISIYTEAVGSISNFDAYMRLFLGDLDVLAADQKFKSGKHFLMEILTGFSHWLLDVLSENRVATEFSYQSNRGDLKFDYSEAFWKSLKNTEEKIPREFKNISF